MYYTKWKGVCQALRLGNLEIFEVSTVPSELLSSLKSGKGNRGRVITDNSEAFHACIVPEFAPHVKHVVHVFLDYLWS
jgi:hypothetical protein|tara:strand:- start:138 stop:371 length:234 start_codon:yes stop_codon:yes gene_type:complete